MLALKLWKDSKEFPLLHPRHLEVENLLSVRGACRHKWQAEVIWDSEKIRGPKLGERQHHAAQAVVLESRR